MAAVMVARQGRELQRYSDSTGGRVVVGCIPYRLRAGGEGFSTRCNLKLEELP